ncbi:MAG: thioredoxin-dependent thiol peroxidase [Peptostreptococcaceae bacterium]
MLEAGVKAPDFKLQDKDGNLVSLSDFKNRKVVLYFYPKDNTPGCTKQACSFRDNYEAFESKDVVVIGISKDGTKSHERFTQKHGLPFILLSDPELEVIKAYDVWKEKKLYGKIGLGIARTTYIIDENGVIEKVYDKVKTDKNVGEVLEYLGE